MVHHSYYCTIRKAYFVGILGLSFTYLLTFSFRDKSSRRQFTSVHVRRLERFENQSDGLVQSITFGTKSSSRDDDSGSCEPPELIVDGLPWPECIPKYHWMKLHSDTDTCYKDYGVNPEDGCSILTYLSTQERFCPAQRHVQPQFTFYYEEEPLTPRFDFTNLYDELAKHGDVSWINHRISTMESMWITNTKRLLKAHPAVLSKKRIHIHLGLVRLGMGKKAWKGGPLGELVQWADIIASLYVLGHDIVISSTMLDILHLYKSSNKLFSNSCTPPSVYEKRVIPFDIIYTDINGYRIMLSKIGPKASKSLLCRFRIVDSFGTEAIFNHPPYRDLMNISRSQYNGLDLKLSQFNTMFPHTPDNTFMGFVTEFNHMTIRLNNDSNATNRTIALVYGKSASYWRGKEKYLKIIKEYVTEIHATVSKANDLPSYVINHGIVDRATLGRLLQRSKIFVGLGFPFEGPAPLEAIQFGAVYLNPKFNPSISSLNHNFYKGKPTRREITSQNPYAEKYIGEPYVYTVDIENEDKLRKTLHKIVNAGDMPGKLPHEFSVYGMLERLSIQIDKQQLCIEIPYHPRVSQLEKVRWPPLEALRCLSSKDKVQSCNELCDSAGLICEPSFFPVINRIEWFQNSSVAFPCNEAVIPITQSPDYPAFDEATGICYLQNNAKLFSCAGNNLNYLRLCPCRDYIHGQIALCKSCGL